MSLRVPAVAGKSRIQIENESIAFIFKNFPGHLQVPGKLDVIRCFDLLLDYGLDPGVADLSDGTEGITMPSGAVFLSEKTYRGAARGNGRDRFTVIHECYHGLCHRHQIQFALIHHGPLILARRSEIPAYRDPEWQANTFAAATLLPAATVRTVAQQCGASRNRVNAVAEVFGVTQQPARIRLEQLGLLS